MNNKGKRNNKKKNKPAAQSKKPEDSDGDWEELLKAPLPKEEESKGKKNDTKVNEDEWEDDEDTTATKDTVGSSKATTGHDEIDDDGAAGGKKKRKKRANKRTVAKLKELRKDFIDRCVSPHYFITNRLQLNGEITIRDLKNIDMSREPDAPYRNTRNRKGAKKAQPPPPMPSNDWLTAYNPMDSMYGGLMGGMGMLPSVDTSVPAMFAGAMAQPMMMPQGVLPPPTHKPLPKGLQTQHQFESDGDGNDQSSDDEALLDYQIDGYHPCHVK